MNWNYKSVVRVKTKERVCKRDGQIQSALFWAKSISNGDARGIIFVCSGGVLYVRGGNVNEDVFHMTNQLSFQCSLLRSDIVMWKPSCTR